MELGDTKIVEMELTCVRLRTDQKLGKSIKTMVTMALPKVDGTRQRERGHYEPSYGQLRIFKE